MGLLGCGSVSFLIAAIVAEVLKTLHMLRYVNPVSYTHLIGINSRLDTIQAAILLVKFKAFADNELEAVNSIAHMYDAALGDCGLILPFTPEDCFSSWAQYTVQLPQENIRE